MKLYQKAWAFRQQGLQTVDYTKNLYYTTRISTTSKVACLAWEAKTYNKNAV